MRSKPLNVLILLGSPREDGNSSRLAFAFADAASRNGHRVQSVRLSALEIAPFDGCRRCWPKASQPCVVRDDTTRDHLDALVDALVEAVR